MDGFEAELADTNRRRLRVMLPVMVGVHLVHVAAFRVGERATLAPELLRWHDGVVTVHAVTALVMAGWLAVLLATRPGRWLAPLVAVSYLLHAAVIAGVDQLTVPTVTPFVGYALALAVLLALEPAAAVAVYAVGLGAFVVALVTMQPSDTIRQALLPNGFTITIASVALSWFLHAGRRRDFVQRQTIAAQHRELEQLNTELERRVEAQVAEILTRAEEVERLNTHLRAQVQARSTQLSEALAALSERPPTAPDPQAGTVLAERFEVMERIGAGAMGAVYRGLDRSTGEAVAIKVVHARTSGDGEAHQRFLREARLAAGVRHPGVVRMLHVDVSHDGVLYQVQELVDGETLAAALKRLGRCSPGVAARIGAVLADALASVHAQKVVHRDVKPANAMLTPAWPGLKLLDFGISRPGADEDAFGTRTGMVVGTPAFMGPDVLDGSEPTDRVDVYALGVTLFAALAGRFPFADTSLVGMALNHRGPAPHLRDVTSEVPTPLADLVAACLERDPARRPAAAEVAARLAELADPRSLEELVRDGPLSRTAQLRPVPIA